MAHRSDARWMIPAGAVVVGVALGASGVGSVPLLLAVAGFPIAVLVGRQYPEAALALFLLAGSFVVPGLVPVDTGFYFGAVLAVVLAVGFRSEGARLAGSHLVMLAALFLMLVSFLYGAWTDYTIDKALRAAFSVPLTVFGGAFIARDTRSFRRFVAWLMIGGGALLVSALVVNPPWLGQARLETFAGSPITLGRMAGFVLLGGLASLASRWWSPWWPSLALLVSGGALVLSGSRGPIVALTVSVVVVVAIQLAARRLGARLLAGYALLALSVSTVFLAGGGAVMAQRLTLLAGQDRGESVSMRALLANEASRLVSLRPFTGFGLGSFSEYGSARYPHNLFLEIAAESGLVAAALLAAFLLLALVAALKRLVLKADGIGVVMLGGMVFGLVNSLVSGDLNNNYVLFTLAAAALAFAQSGPGCRSEASANDESDQIL